MLTVESPVVISSYCPIVLTRQMHTDIMSVRTIINIRSLFGSVR